MPLFELDRGRLVPAQFGRTVTSALGEELLETIRAQVLEIIARPLFPITWRDLSRSGNPHSFPRLTALDATGQVVAVEVLEHLTSANLISALSALADTAALSWTDLAREYPGGIVSFREDWTRFRDSMPSTPGAGPRLIMVVASIDMTARSALEVLVASGVEVHELNLRQMSNGRSFLSVNPVGPRVYAHVPQILGQSNEVQAISGAQDSPQEKTQSQPSLHGREQDPREAGVQALVEIRQDDEAPHADELITELQEPDEADINTQPVEQIKAADPIARHAVAPVYPRVQRDSVERASRAHAAAADSIIDQAQQRQQRVEEARQHNIPVLNQDSIGLQALAVILGEDTPLAIAVADAANIPVTLTAQGTVRVWEREYDTVEEAMAYAGQRECDGWRTVRIGDALGPTLAEALDEVNVDILREYGR